MGKTFIAAADSDDRSVPALAVPADELTDTTIHLTLQGKGGVGKSLVAVILAQYLSQRGAQIQCIDTDPLNRTFAQYGALGAERIQVRDEHNRIDQRSFDGLLERFLTEHGATFVVDNGASTFLPLWHYLLENRALEYLQEHQCKIYVHTVITGGQALLDTLNGFRELAESTQQRNIVIWINEYFGRVEAQGKSFSEMNAFRDSVHKICGVVVIPKRNQDTFGRDIEDMISRKWTFEEAIVAPEFHLLAKQRLTIVRRELFEQLDKISF
jgi:CobQ/CobB/MinD/ParA family nucleotide binding protein